MKNLLLTLKLLRSLLLTATCTLALSAPAAPVLFGSNGHYYDFVPANLTWEAANTAAGLRTYLGTAGHLATITSAAEQNFLYSQVIQLLPPAAMASGAWLGGYQLPGSPEPAGGWTWTTGETWAYANWTPGEPNDGVGWGMTPENNLLILSTGLWNDGPNNRIGYPGLPYVVEFDVVPEPSAFALSALGLAAVGLCRRQK